MKVVAVSTPENAVEIIAMSNAQGYITFVYEHADPEKLLVNDKFLYVSSDEELLEKLHLLKADFTARDLIRR